MTPLPIDPIIPTVIEGLAEEVLDRRGPARLWQDDAAAAGDTRIRITLSRASKGTRPSAASHRGPRRRGEGRGRTWVVARRSSRLSSPL